VKATLIQSDIVWGDPQANLREAERFLRAHKGSDIYVFPEMFTTGFATQQNARIDENPEQTIEWMQQKAEELDAAIVGSIAMRSGEKLVNRLVFARPGQDAEFYDKRHLFTYGGEPDRFSAGNERKIIEYRGIRFLTLICYDVRFPVWIRNRDDYDAIICVANWPDVRQDAWQTLTKARSIENQCYVLAVNRSGKDPVCNYLGGTTLYDPFGQAVVKAADYQAEAVTGEIDMNLLENFKAKFPVLDDADKFKLL